MRTPTEMVKNGQSVHFTHAHQGQLWYATECNFAFPVPIEEIGDATFEATDKALLFLRYIRAQHKTPQPLVLSAVSLTPGVSFIHYRKENLWYATTDGFTFPVPFETSEKDVLPVSSSIDPLFSSHIHRHRVFLDQARIARRICHDTSSHPALHSSWRIPASSGPVVALAPPCAAGIQGDCPYASVPAPAQGGAQLAFL